MNFTWVLISLLSITSANVTLTSLDGSTIFTEDLGTAKIYHTTWRLISSVDTHNIDKRYEQINLLYKSVFERCDQCLEQFELETLKSRIKRINVRRLLLNQLLGKNRYKRGAFNFVGSISKTLFGTLSEGDLDYVNHELDQLYSQNKLLKMSLQNQTKVIRTILNSAAHDVDSLFLKNKNIIDSYNKLANKTNENIENIVMANQVTIMTVVISELSEDISLLIDAINDGKHGIIHPQILPPTTLIEGFKQFEEENNEKHGIQLVEENYQYLIDISEITVLLINNKLVYSIQMPILEKEIYKINHLIPIPLRKGDNFITVIPNENYVMINDQRTLYIPTSETDLSYCKLLGITKICKRKNPSYLLAETKSCETQLIKNSVKIINNKMCQINVIFIDQTVFYILQNEQGAIMIPNKEEIVQIYCKNSNYEKSITGVTLITALDNCILHTEYTIVKLSKTKVKTQNFSYRKNVTIPFSESDLNLVRDEFLPLKGQLNDQELKLAGKSLDEIETVLNKVQSIRRSHSWKEKATDILSYLGYTSLILMSVFALYKCGVCEIIRKCLPNLRLNFCCTTNKINNEIIPHVVTYVPARAPTIDLESKLDSKPIKFRRN